MLQSLIVPENKRTPEWAQKAIKGIVQMCDASAQKADRQAFEHVEGLFNEEDLQYIIKQFGTDNELPAKLRHMPLVKKHTNALMGEEMLRAINFRVYSIDADAIDERRQEMGQMVIRDLNSILVEAQRRKIKAIQNGLPEKSAEYIEQEINRLEKYYKYSYQSVLEISTQKAAKYLIQQLTIKEKANTLFFNKLVTGKQIWRTIAQVGKDPEVEIVRPEYFYYCASDNEKWIKYSDWAVQEKYMTPTEILDAFDGELSETDVRKLEKWAVNYQNIANQYYAGESRLDADGYYDAKRPFKTATNVYRGNVDDIGKVRVCYVEWVVNRVVKEQVSEKQDGFVFTKVMGDTYRPRSSKKKTITKYVQDRWSGSLIGPDIFAKVGKDEHVIRPVDNPSRAPLSFNGCNDGISLTESVTDIQILYNLLHYHREAMIAISGSAGMVYDLAQKPDGYELEDIMYYKKMGIVLINSAQKGRTATNFNQFQTYDDTLKAAVSILDQMIASLDILCGDILGVPPQRRGAMKSDELVGNNEMALEKSATVTAVLYKSHDAAIRELLNDMINACKISWKDGKKGQFILPDYEMEMFTLDAGMLDNREMGVFFSDSQAEEQKIRELRQVATQAAQKSMQETGINFSDLIKIFSKDSLREIQIEMDEAIAKKQEEMQKQAQAQAEATQKAEGDKSKIAADTLAINTRQKDRELDLKEKELNLKYGEGGVEVRKIEEKAEVDRKTLENDNIRLQLEKVEAQNGGGGGNSSEINNQAA